MEKPTSFSYIKVTDKVIDIEALRTKMANQGKKILMRLLKESPTTIEITKDEFSCLDMYIKTKQWVVELDDYEKVMKIWKVMENHKIIG